MSTLVTPLAPLLAGHYVDRVLVLVAGAALWGTMTAAFSTCKTVSQVRTQLRCAHAALSLLDCAGTQYLVLPVVQVLSLPGFSV